MYNTSSKLKKESERLPLLKGFVKNGQLAVWCPCCWKIHFHGSNNMEIRPTHRVAHCPYRTSLFYEKGYYVQKFSKKDLKEMGL